MLPSSPRPVLDHGWCRGAFWPAVSYIPSYIQIAIQFDHVASPVSFLNSSPSQARRRRRGCFRLSEMLLSRRACRIVKLTSKYGDISRTATLTSGSPRTTSRPAVKHIALEALSTRTLIFTPCARLTILTVLRTRMALPRDKRPQRPQGRHDQVDLRFSERRWATGGPVERVW